MMKVVVETNNAQLTKEQLEKLQFLKQYACNYNVPIIQEDGMEFIINLIKTNAVINILEIGTAIGYSSINMALYTASFVTTIERNEAMFEQATKNVNDLNLNNKIKLIFKDALEAYDDVKDKKYDLIFIDAAKGQYEKFFKLYENLLTQSGIIVSDNLKFHGFVDTNEVIPSKNLNSLVKKIRNYIEFLKNNEDYQTTFYDIADGLAVSQKNNFNI